MKMSNSFIPTLRQNPQDVEVPSHRLMLRAGLMRKVAPGVYALLPLGVRVVQKVMRIVREEMDASGGLEMSLPVMLPAEPWLASGRWSDYGNEMFRLKDRQGAQYCLAPTHEEVITTLVRDEVKSYRQLPLLLYHIGPKFRDEIRPRFGMMRSREFLMKDLYSFDRTPEELEHSYRRMYEAYSKIFARCALDFCVVEADTGDIGGHTSHEFTALAEHGESRIVVCSSCGFAATTEHAPAAHAIASDETQLPMHKVATPGIHTIQQVSQFLDIQVESTSKILFYWAEMRDGSRKMVAGLVLGSHELNELKLKRVIDAASLTLAQPEEVMHVLGVPVGSAGPVGLSSVLSVTDRHVACSRNLVMGANEEGYHLKNVNPYRDFGPTLVEDIVTVGEGYICAQCGSTLEESRGIEVGQLFKLDTKYSGSLGAVYISETGEPCNMLMGCYGIGITRTVAAVIEQHHDERGIKWPLSVAPYHAVVLAINSKHHEQAGLAVRVYESLVSAGVETILDDRDERAGVKFADADLVGYPYRVNVGRRAAEQVVELVNREDGTTHETQWNEAVRTIADAVRAGGS